MARSLLGHTNGKGIGDSLPGGSGPQVAEGKGDNT
jgi:hypothetical protein